MRGVAFWPNQAHVPVITGIERLGRWWLRAGWAPSATETAMQQAQVSPRFRVRPGEPQAANDNLSGGLRCPACRRVDTVGFAGSDYHGHGIRHHRWHCDACGHDWVTVLHV